MIPAEELIHQHARAFSRLDWDAVREYWHPDGELVSPGGRWPVTSMRAIMRDLDAQYRDVDIQVTNVIQSADESYIAFEWTYASTRRSDGARSVTPDAIIVEFRDGLIYSWREYFDQSHSVELGQPAAAAGERLA
jgi:ketosteroid isomerase-like protein